MKKFFILLSLSFAYFFCAFAQYSGFCGTDSLQWSLNMNSGELRIFGHGIMANYDTATDAPWVNLRDCVITVVVAEGVTNLSASAFKNCYNATSADIANSVTVIPARLFDGCRNLASIMLGNSVQSIQTSAFPIGLQELTIHTDTPPQLNIDVSSNGVFPFSNNTPIYVPREAVADYKMAPNWRACNIKAIGDSAATDEDDNKCGDYLTWEFSDTTLYIWGFGDMYDFYTTMAPWADYGEDVRVIYISDSATSIGANAFNECYNVFNLTLGSNISSVNVTAFSQSLQQLTIRAVTPPTVQTDGYTSFFFGTATIIYVPVDAVDTYKATDIWKDFDIRAMDGGDQPGDDALSGMCGDNVQWELNENTGMLRIYGNGDMFDYVTAGAPWSQYAQSIQTIVMEEGVTKIGDGAFMSCHMASTISIPNSVTVIGAYAFNGCRSLNEITLGNQVDSLCASAFGIALQKLTIYTTTPPKLTIDASSSWLFAFADTTPVYVPGSAVRTYQSAPNWRACNIQALPTYNIVLFVNDSNLGSVEGAGNYDVGNTVVVTAYPFTGSYFQCWSDGSMDSVRYIKVTRDIRLTALFASLATDTTPDYVVTATDTTATISVPLYQNDSVSYYRMTITTSDSDTIILCLDATGQIINDSSWYSYVHENGTRNTSRKYRLLGASAPVNISISGLLAGKRYTYTIDAIDHSGNIINRQDGKFATTEQTTVIIENAVDAKLRSTKQIINGQLYIITADGQRYTANGVRK